MDNILQFKKNEDLDQDLESMDFELCQIYLFQQMSEKQRAQFLKGKSVQEVLDTQFKLLNRVRKKMD